MRPYLSFTVAGKPAPQGSKRGFIVNGRVNLVENSKKVDPWRGDVAYAANIAMKEAGLDKLLDGVPIAVQVEFVMPRPAGTAKTKPTPPAIKRNADIDKLLRSTLDAMTDVIFTDDSLVIRANCTKRIADIGEGAGAIITVEEVPWPTVK